MEKARATEVALTVQAVAAFEGAFEMVTFVHPKAQLVLEQVGCEMANRLTTFIECAAAERNKSNKLTRSRMRRSLVEAINSLAHAYLVQAKQGFCELLATRVLLLTDTSHGAKTPCWDHFDVDDFLFISSKGPAIDAALKIRELTSRVQIQALKLAHSRWDVMNLEFGIATANFYGDTSPSRQEKMLKQRQCDQSTIEKNMKSAVREHVSSFCDAMAGASLYEFTIPIAVPYSATDDLALICESLFRFGRELRISDQFIFEGSRNAVRRAHLAKSKFEKAGLGLRALAGWAKATNVIDKEAHCVICYRHAATAYYCKEHASQLDGSKSRAARLGERVKLAYEQRLTLYSHSQDMQKLVDWKLDYQELKSPALLQAAKRYGLKPDMQDSAVLLACQLRQLRLVMNDEMQVMAQAHFESILKTVRWIEEQAKAIPSNGRSSIETDRLLDSARRALTLSEFFRTWCAEGRTSSDGIALRGFDRDHPIVMTHAIAAPDVVKGIMRQRAWHEALIEFQSANMPTAEDIDRARKSGLTMKDVASEMGLALSTVYKIRSRGVVKRNRNYFR